MPKGLSPFIAAIMLIAFTVAIGAVIALFLTGFFKSSSNTVGGGASSTINCADSTPQVTGVRYPTSGSGMMNVSFFNPGNDNLNNITIYTKMSGIFTVFANSSGSLASSVANSTQLFNINGLGTPLEIRVVGLCGSTVVSGTCLVGQSCMIGV